jgi:hypothetical protein
MRNIEEGTGKDKKKEERRKERRRKKERRERRGREISYFFTLFLS